MKVTVSGATPALARELQDAARFYGKILLNNDVFTNIILSIEINSNMESVGSCHDEEYGRFPTIFAIDLLGNPEIEDPIKTLAHEMVHLKQFATGQLSNVVVVTKGGNPTWQTKWEGNVWEPQGNEHPYFDSPWEIEAYGREVGLYERWVEFYNANHVDYMAK